MEDKEIIETYENRIESLMNDINHLAIKIDETTWDEDSLENERPDEVQYIEDYLHRMMGEVSEEKRMIRLMRK